MSINNVFSKKLYEHVSTRVHIPEAMRGKYIGEIFLKDELRKFCIDHDIDNTKEELTDKEIKDFQTVINTAQLNYPTGEKYVIKQEDKEYLEQKVENAVKKYKNTLEYIVLMGMKIDNQETFKEILEKNFNDYKENIKQNITRTRKNNKRIF